jgi:hypothetical protein
MNDLIRSFKIWNAQRKLAKLVEVRRRSLVLSEYRKHSAASRLGWARRRNAARG